MKTGARRRERGTQGLGEGFEVGDLCLGRRQIERTHVRGEMMHKWNKDERIESLYREKRKKEKNDDRSERMGENPFADLFCSASRGPISYT